MLGLIALVAIVVWRENMESGSVVLTVGAEQIVPERGDGND